MITSNAKNERKTTELGDQISQTTIEPPMTSCHITVQFPQACKV